jgi:hypothetical protein
MTQEELELEMLAANWTPTEGFPGKWRYVDSAGMVWKVIFQGEGPHIAYSPLGGIQGTRLARLEDVHAWMKRRLLI